jgi:hypothetical protein
MSLLDVLQPRQVQHPEPSFIHRCHDDPDEEIVETRYEKRLRQMREWHAKNDKRKKELNRLCEGLQV